MSNDRPGAPGRGPRKSARPARTTESALATLAPGDIMPTVGVHREVRLLGDDGIWAITPDGQRIFVGARHASDT